MKKLTILSIFFATAGLLSACGETMNPSRLVGAGKPAIIASSANPSTSETVTFSLAVSGGVLPGTAVWSDDCNGEFYSQDGTQATWQNKWAETCTVTAKFFTAAVTAAVATAAVTVTTRYDKGTIVKVAGGSCFHRETWSEDNPMRDEGVLATQAALGRLGGIAVAPNGEVYFTDRQGGRVLKVDTGGRIRRVAGLKEGNYNSDDGDGGSALKARLLWPYDVALDRKGNIYVSSYWGYRVRKIDAQTGIITTYAGDGDAGSPTPGAKANETKIEPLYLDFDGKDNLYITSRSYGSAYKIYAEGGTITTLPGTFNYPFGIAWTPTGIYVASRYDYQVLRIHEGTGTASVFAGNGTEGYAGDGSDAVNAELSQVYAVDVSKNGTVYIGDTYNRVIRAVTGDGKIQTVIGPGLNTLPGDGGIAKGHFVNPSDIEIDANGDMYIADRLSCQIKKVVGPY